MLFPSTGSEKTLYYRQMKTPLGELTLTADEDHLLSVDFSDHTILSPVSRNIIKSELPVLEQAVTELTEYFDGKRRDFTVSCLFKGTPFQTQVWQELARIPFGGTVSYGELASRIGKPKACRAVGQANNKNPLAIIVPCHRVIGKNGGLVGYGSGLDKKAWLLDFERRLV